jgi:hypothetical protein
MYKYRNASVAVSTGSVSLLELLVIVIVPRHVLPHIQIKHSLHRLAFTSSRIHRIVPGTQSWRSRLHDLSNVQSQVHQRATQGGRSCRLHCTRCRPVLVYFGNTLWRYAHRRVPGACQAKSGELEVLCSKRLGLPLPFVLNSTAECNKFTQSF